MNETELLFDLGRLGIQLEADGERLLYFPKSALTPDLLARLTSHKVELLAMLRPPSRPSEDPVKPTTAVCRCGSTTCRDVPIHDGQSTRRDCGACSRFIDFPIWYGNSARQFD